MTHSPPVPDGNQSPYPLQEPPHHHGPAGPPPGTPVARKEGRTGTLVWGVLAAIGVGAVAAGGMWAWQRGAPKTGRRKRKTARKS